MSYSGVPQNLPTAFRCTNHPEREGVGICVGCRAVVCVECTTKIDQMNYCIRCLSEAAPAAHPATRPENPRRETLLGIPLLLASFLVTVALFAALGFLLALARNWTPGGVTGG